MGEVRQFRYGKAGCFVVSSVSVGSVRVRQLRRGMKGRVRSGEVWSVKAVAVRLGKIRRVW